MEFSSEPFSGFDMTDDEVPEGECRQVALKLKHVFERLVEDADKQNQEYLIEAKLEDALRRLLVDPVKDSLEHLLAISPSLAEPVNTIIVGQTSRVAHQWCGDRFDGEPHEEFSEHTLITAREEIAHMLEVGRQQDGAAGGKSLWRSDIAFALKAFLVEPTSSNANSLLKLMPPLAAYFRSTKRR